MVATASEPTSASRLERAQATIDRTVARLALAWPLLRRAWMAAIGPPSPRTTPIPGWRFAQEFTHQRRRDARRRWAIWALARDRKLKIEFATKWLGQTEILTSLGDDQSLCLWVCGSFEPNEFAFLDRVLEPNMIVVDAGANQGLYSVFAGKRVGSGGRVIAFEPSRRDCEMLRSNVAHNSLGNVEVIPTALGDTMGNGILHIADGEHAGQNTFGVFAWEGTQERSVENVPVTTLDSEVERLDLRRLDFLKIDVEGAEVALLRGARRSLERFKPTILVEVNPRTLSGMGESVQTLVEALVQLGYTLERFSLVTGLPEPWRAGQPAPDTLIARAARK
ncbi:MAG: FkbM family methyltransferase [Alphaproteobacteria bacterium]|nr:FkbM family methyltransferase [Alphaproteobacteria bacterium]